MGSCGALAGGLLIRRTTVATMAAVAMLVSACSTPTPNQVTGIVTEIDGDLTTVISFEVFADGRTWRFEPAPDGDFAFPLPHLRDHLRAGDPIVVTYIDDTDPLMATAISDG